MSDLNWFKCFNPEVMSLNHHLNGLKDCFKGAQNVSFQLFVSGMVTLIHRNILLTCIKKCPIFPTPLGLLWPSVPPAATLLCIGLFSLTVKDRKQPGRRTEDSSTPIRGQGALVSIKWYVPIPQITDTCSPLPSHPVAFLLHHLTQRNHPHYLMRPYCTHKYPPNTCVYSLLALNSIINTLKPEPLPHCQQSDSFSHHTEKPLIPQ